MPSTSHSSASTITPIEVGPRLPWGTRVRRIVEIPSAPGRPTENPVSRAPRRGEHNGEILRDWLAVDDGEVKALQESGVLLDDAG